MSTEPGGEATEVVITEAAHEAAVSSPESGKPAERDFEAEAREQGWRPQEEWTGKPENWKDAKTFVEYGEVNNRVFRVEKDYAERFKRLEAVTSKTIERLQAAHEKEMADLRAQRREAIKEGDAEKVDALDTRIDALKEAKAETAKIKSFDEIDDGYAPDLTTEAGKEQYAALVRGFVKANEWMLDPDMAEFAEKWSERNAAANPNIGFKVNARATEAAVRKKFPNYFANTNTAANGHAAVDSGGAFLGATRSDPLSKLPNEARAQAASDMKKYPKIYPTAESWIKAYNG